MLIVRPLAGDLLLMRNMLKYRVRAVCMAVLCFMAEWAVAQHGAIGVAYYDVDALYDTIPSKFYDDRAYTPDGDMRWNTERYMRKVRHTAAVIDSLAMPIVALRGVESEQVVRDVLSVSKRLYSYVHRTDDFNRGKDFALLYYGDVFTPKRVRQYGSALCVEGEITNGGDLAVVVHYRSRDLAYIVGQLRKANPECRVILLGGSSRVDFSALKLKNHCTSIERKGMGTRFWHGRWLMSDCIASDIEGSVQARVYVRKWLLSSAGVPLPTYERGKYVGGYSFNLPVYVYFDEFFVN